MKIHKVYKVVNSEFRSVVVSRELDLQDIAVNYKIGERTIPSIPKSPLFAFKTLKAAKSFVMPGQIILECSAKRWHKRIPDEILAPWYNSTTEFKTLWHCPGGVDLDYYDTIPIPDETILCSEIIPERIIEQD